MRARIYVIYGQGGWITSIGMSRLASRLAKLYPSAAITTHSWKYPGAIQTDMFMVPKTVPVIVIGYSLGANCVTWVADGRRTIDLAVCYDPSVLSAVNPIGTNIKRLLLYHNIDNEPEGHAIITGPQVERTDISMWHLAVCFSEALHQKTLAAITKLIGPPT